MDLTKYKIKQSTKKIDFSYQSLGVEMESYFKKNIWYLFYKKEYNEDMIRDAFKICQENNKREVGYLIGILRKL